ncbi:NAD(P)-binding domain-containing protein, partial [bacterium]|nr:NAD(P)-binding domain-containing protein [bacterium]
MNLEKKIKSKQASIAVIGLGYVGLPLVKTFLENGFKVIGFDVDPQKVDQLNKGKSYIRDVKGEDLKDHLKKKEFQATSDYKKLSQVDVIIVCVPTPLDTHRNPDLSFVLQTT